MSTQSCTHTCTLESSHYPVTHQRHRSGSLFGESAHNAMTQHNTLLITSSLYAVKECIFLWESTLRVCVVAVSTHGMCSIRYKALNLLTRTIGPSLATLKVTHIRVIMAVTHTQIPTHISCVIGCIGKISCPRLTWGVR